MVCLLDSRGPIELDFVAGQKTTRLPNNQEGFSGHFQCGHQEAVSSTMHPLKVAETPPFSLKFIEILEPVP